MAKLVDLKAEAEMLGVEFEDGIKFKALEKKLKDFKEANMPKEVEENEEDQGVEIKEVEVVEQKTYSQIDISMLKAGADTDGIKIHPTQEDLENQKSSKGLSAVKKATRIYKVIITNMNPETQDQPTLHQDIWSANHGLLSSRFIPFNTPWHAEKCLIDYLMEEEYPHKKEVITKNESGANETHIETVMRKKYGIQLLPDNTEEEMKQLASDQRKTDRIG